MRTFAEALVTSTGRSCSRSASRGQRGPDLHPLRRQPPVRRGFHRCLASGVRRGVQRRLRVVDRWAGEPRRAQIDVSVPAAGQQHIGESARRLKSSAPRRGSRSNSSPNPGGVHSDHDAGTGSVTVEKSPAEGVPPACPVNMSAADAGRGVAVGQGPAGHGGEQSGEQHPGWAAGRDSDAICTAAMLKTWQARLTSDGPDRQFVTLRRDESSRLWIIDRVPSTSRASCSDTCQTRRGSWAAGFRNAAKTPSARSATPSCSLRSVEVEQVVSSTRGC